MWDSEWLDSQDISQDFQCQGIVKDSTQKKMGVIPKSLSLTQSIFNLYNIFHIKSYKSCDDLPLVHVKTFLLKI